jgi:hypothetical protein
MQIGAETDQLTENQVRREKLGKRRVLLNDDQRRPLAVKGKMLGRKMLEQLVAIVAHSRLQPTKSSAVAGRPSFLSIRCSWVFRARWHNYSSL